ncbi:hypothetical protein FZ103_10450 [Streptomonospora sp. PA3]|uniref:hypothetical protein n=1 Tax=Streptomonospora sp. PA3 TaxID=2607326 RepID=UPI0012DEF583|nr:hypothetical protein [Streptomonospora sp. PA3]MUL41590.1 hypothetical protein [Streptomonospora sp. PA3]
MLIGVCSLGGSPGATTLALGLAATWQATADQPILVEADAAGGDVAAWRGRSSEVGLVSLAAQARTPRPEGHNLLWEHTRPLQGGVAAVLAPAAPHRAAPSVWQLTQAVEVLRPPRSAIVLDLGRVAPGTSGAWLAARTDAVVVVTATEVAQIRRLADCTEILAALPGRRNVPLGLAVVGGGASTAEIAEHTGLQVWGRIPRDGVAADYIAGRRLGRAERMARRPLLLAAAALGRRAHTEHQARQEQLRERIAGGPAAAQPTGGAR